MRERPIIGRLGWERDGSPCCIGLELGLGLHPDFWFLNFSPVFFCWRFMREAGTWDSWRSRHRSKRVGDSPSLVVGVQKGVRRLAVGWSLLLLSARWLFALSKTTWVSLAFARFNEFPCQGVEFTLVLDPVVFVVGYSLTCVTAWPAFPRCLPGNLPVSSVKPDNSSSSPPSQSCGQKGLQQLEPASGNPGRQDQPSSCRGLGGCYPDDMQEGSIIRI